MSVEIRSSQHRVRLAHKQTEAVDICSLELVAADDQPLPAFTAGAHIDVQLSGGLVRQYSLANDPADTHRYLIGVLKDNRSRGGSLAMHALQPGALLAISAPRNLFALTETATHSVLIAGGIGLTPLLSMAERLARLAASFELHVCTRSAAHTAFAQRLGTAAWAGSVQLHHDDGPAHQRLDPAAALGAPRDGVHVYVCGPAGFMDWVLGAARTQGWPEAQLHREVFAAAATATGDDGEFEVQVASTGRVIPVAADQTVVAALAAAGVEVPVSCEQGVCGTCLTRVVSGTPDHRDVFLTEDERAQGDQFLPCCSRARSPRLVLDL